MRLQEYQAKDIFLKYGIPVPDGTVATKSIEAKKAAEKLGGRVAIKAQVLSGGRGKAGGIFISESIENVEEEANQILNMTLKGLPVKKLLVEKAVDIQAQYYLGVSIDREKSLPLLIASGNGGVDVEDIAVQNPEKIIKYPIPLLLGLHDYLLRNLALAIDLPREQWVQFFQNAQGLWRIFNECEATLAEINPLALTETNGLIAIDGKMELDENALFRHSDLAFLRDLENEDPIETEARKAGIAYVKMDGNVACLVNGAGLAMATMDMIKYVGGQPANFLDVGGGADSNKVLAALGLILADQKVDSVFINIFGGITRCDEVARGLIKGMKKYNPRVPIVLRLQGNHAREAQELLFQNKISVTDDFSCAARTAVDLAVRN